MKKCLIFFCLLVVTLATAQSTKEIEVNFETASYHLSNAEAGKINNYIAALSNGIQTYKITIVGHTDNVGNFEYNKVLSDNRANEIAAYFRQKGFPEKNIKTFGKAYSEPIAANSTESGKSKNRRVSVFISTEITKVNDLGGLKLEEDSFSIDAQKKEVVNYKSGTKITIPADAFVDENGKIVTGKVDLTYVEYRNPVDFILGNIPMDFEKDHFNSAGMYKILAYKDNKPVFLREGKQIDMDFTLESELPDLNFYNFDTISNKWTELSRLTKAKIEQPKGEIAETDLATAPNGKVNSRGIFVTIGQRDTLRTYTSECWVATTVIADGIEFASATTSIMPQYLSEKEKRAADSQLKQQNYLAGRKNASMNNTFTQKSIKSLEARIKRNELKSKRIQQLIKNAGLHMNKQAKIAYTERQNKVNDSLLSRNKSYEEKIIALKNPQLDSLKIEPDYLTPNRLYVFWKANKNYMTKEESAMDIDNWFTYFDTHKPEMLQRYKGINVEKICSEEQRKAIQQQQKINKVYEAADAAVQSLQISQLGIYNCDQIARLQNPVIVDATYKDENGANFKPYFIYLVDSKINGILRYDGNYDYSPSHFAYSPASKNTLLAFDGNGVAYILSSGNFSKSFNGKSSVTVTMKKLENISNREQLAQLF